jgi:hypothetical protein
LYDDTRTYYLSRIKSKETKWNRMSRDEKANYSVSTTEEGNKKLDFRFAH